MKSSRSATSAHFAKRISKQDKLESGRTSVTETPLHVRAAGVLLDPEVRSWVRARTGRQLGKFASHIERISLRFADVNGPRGGSDTVCRAKVVLSGLPSVVVEERARTPRAAFDLVAPATGRAVQKALGRAAPVLASRGARGLSVRKSGSAGGQTAASTLRSARRVGAPEGSLIGRRVGQGRENLRRAAARPEKTRRDALVDTSLPGVSATDRKVGLRGTASRNTKLNRAGMTAALEDSATGKPSRKSTRGSQNRAKSGSKQGRRTKRTLTSPKARARRAAARSSS